MACIFLSSLLAVLFPPSLLSFFNYCIMQNMYHKDIYSIYLWLIERNNKPWTALCLRLHRIFVQSLQYLRKNTVEQNKEIILGKYLIVKCMKKIAWHNEATLAQWKKNQYNRGFLNNYALSKKNPRVIIGQHNWLTFTKGEVFRETL